MKNFLNYTPVAAVAAILSVSNAAAVPVDTNFNYKNFQCEGCYAFSIDENDYFGGNLGTLVRYSGVGGGVPNLHDVPAVQTILTYADDSTLYIDTANNAIYLAAEVTSRVAEYGVSHISYHGDLNVFRQKMQLYIQYTSGVNITTDENGVPIDIRVTGMSPDNGGFLLWNSGQFAAELNSKPNMSGIALWYDPQIDSYASWFKGGLMYYLNANGNPIHEKGKYLVQADVMYNFTLKDKPHTEEVPEPATALLIGSAIAVGARIRRSRSTPQDETRIFDRATG